MSTKDKKRTGPGVSDPQGPAGVGGIVPAPSQSSSGVGLPSGSPESPGGKSAISVMAAGLAKALSASKPKGAGREGSSGQRSNPETDIGARANPGPSTLGPSRVEAVAGDAAFKRPGPLSKKKKKATVTVEPSGESSSDGISGDGDMTPFSGMSSDTNRVVSQGGHQEVIGRLYEEVAVERSLLAGRFRASFRTAVGRIPSADDLMREYTDYTVDSLINIIFEEMEVVEFIAERSSSLRVIGTCYVPGCRGSKREFGRRGARSLFRVKRTYVVLPGVTCDLKRSELLFGLRIGGLFVGVHDRDDYITVLCYWMIGRA